MSDHVNEYLGQEALNFAERYLKKVKVDPVTWEIEYLDDESGDRWILDYPESGQLGGGNPRLRLQTR